MRLFTAGSLDAEAFGSLERAVDAAAGVAGGPRWAARELWHVTLVFLGEVPEDRVPRLRRELAGVASGVAPFTLRVAGAGTFPRGGAPMVFWAGLDGDTDRLEALVTALRRASRRSGVHVDRKPYHPHLTLGRWRPRDGGTRDVVSALAGYAGPPFRVGEFTLFRSHLGSAVRHEPLETWPLSG
jgi:RNA 2',3'-cyclic 3'-phosphodiesterase